MKKSTLLLMAATVFAAGSLLAQGPDFRRERRPGKPDRPDRVEKAPRTEMTKEWERVQAELKKKAPEKYAEIEKLLATNLFAAMEKMRELAVEEKIPLPPPGRRMGRERGMEGRHMRGFGERDRMPRGPREMARPGRGAGRAVVEAKLKKEYPEEYAKIEQARLNVEDQLQALAKKANVKLPDTPETMRLRMEQLKNKFPKEFAEIEKLRKEDPRAANEKMQELAKKAGIDLPLPPRRRGPKGEPGRFGNPMPELRRRFPEKMRELDKIRRSSPVEYRTQIRELMKKMEAEKAEE